MLIYILLTNRCNLSCKHCIRGEYDIIDIKTDSFFCVIRQIQDSFPHASIVLTGGEPTIHPDFERMIEYSLSNYKQQIILTTNGTTPYFISEHKLLYHPRLHYQFSIDGYADKHDLIRGIGSFNAIQISLSKLRSLNIPIWVSTVVTSENYDSILKLGEYLTGFGIRKWHINPVMPFGKASKEMCISIGKWNSLVKTIRKEIPLKLSISPLYDFSFWDQIDEQHIQTFKNCARLQCGINCGSGNQKLYVYPDLSVYGCTCCTQFPFGNLSRESFVQILESPNAKAIRNYTVLSSSPCTKCKYLPICNGGCIGMSLETFGKIGYGDSRCPKFQEYLNE